ncbi:MAG: peptidoglycan-binding protein [Oscillospiraceae bacterium]|nr:peptidoglycan-binding protein [Oscillospiraceae bacterium]
MPTVMIFNQDSGRMERYERDWDAPMPYNAGRTLTVREFRGSSCSPLLWSDRRTMEAWNRTRAAYGRGIYVGAAFNRIWEGGHAGQSHHYAGAAFCVGQDLTAEQRAELRGAAVRSRDWVDVEPAESNPGRVCFDRRFLPPACETGGYPALREGGRGNYVLILQDALFTLGYTGSGLDGVFGPGTKAALIRYQQDNGLFPDGVAGCLTWTKLTGQTAGIGARRTTVAPCYGSM